MYLGVIPTGEATFIGTTGTIDLQNTGFKTIDGVEQVWDYPINSPCSIDSSIIQVDFQGTGLMANGRDSADNTLNNEDWTVNAKQNTILYLSDASTLAFDREDGLVCVNYAEYEHEQEDEGQEDQSFIYTKDTNETYKYFVVYPNFFQRGLKFDTTTVPDKVLVDLSEPNSAFEPNTYLNANGFNFTLSLNYTGNLTLTRPFDYKNYNTSATTTTYNNQQASTWANFTNYVDNPSTPIPNGVAFSGYFAEYLGTNVTAPNTAGSISNLSVIGTGANTYCEMNAGTVNQRYNPAFVYFAFDKPIQFDNVIMTNHADVANYGFGYFSIDVSNDFYNWISVLANPVSDWNAGYLPVPIAANPNNTNNATWQFTDIKFPNNGYYKFVRVGFVPTGTRRALVRGVFLGGNNAIIAGSETLRELVLEDVPFLNDGTDGINLDIVKKPDYTAYQVQFEDRLGYVKVEGTKGEVVPNDTPVYADINCTRKLEDSTTAYELQCKKYIRNYVDNGYSLVLRRGAMSTLTPLSVSTDILMFDVSTGTANNAWNCLWDNNAAYDFANGTEWTYFTLKYHEKCVMNWMQFKNYNGAENNPQNITIEGSNDAYSSDSPTWENVISTDLNFVSAGGAVAYAPDWNFSNITAGQGIIPSYAALSGKTNKPWAVYLEFTTGTNVSTEQSLVDRLYQAGGTIIRLAGGVMKLWLSSNGGSHNIANGNAGTYSYQPSTRYHIKLEYTGTQYILSYSTDDGGTYTPDITITNATPIFGTELFAIGSGLYDNLLPFLGTIHLNGCYVESEDVLVWKHAGEGLNTWEVNGTLGCLGGSRHARAHWLVPLQAKKEYMYYRVGMKRYNNRILMELVKGNGIYLSPYNLATKNVLVWGDDLSEVEDRPLRHMTIPINSSSSAIPENDGRWNFAAPVSPTTTWKITQFSAEHWNPNNGSPWNILWYYAQYPIRMAIWQQYTYTDAQWITQFLEIFSTNNPTVDNNTITKDYHRLANLYNNSDIPTSLLNNNAINTAYLSILSDNSSHIGYKYNKMLLNRQTNNSSLIRECNLYMPFPEPKIVPMYYTEEWKWTNAYGEAGTAYTLSVYDDPFFIEGTSKTYTPSYRLEYGAETAWTTTPGESGGYLSNGFSGIFENDNCVGQNLAPVEYAYEVQYTTIAGVLKTGYLRTEGTLGDNVPNNTVVYLEPNFNPTNVEKVQYAYEVQYDGQTGYVTVAGESGTYASEGTIVYTDPEFTTQLVVALADNWQYDNVVNKKYAFTGNVDRKWQYTGDIDNVYRYTGKIEGWKYTGTSEQVYDDVPNLEVRINRPDSRRVTKQTQIGIAYPIANQDTPDSIIGYLYDVSGIAGNICPTGLPYYTDPANGQLAGTTDGTQVFHSGLGVARYTYDYKYLPNNNAETGTYIGTGQIMYYDVNLTEPTNPIDVPSDGYYWDSPTYISNIHTFDFPITSGVPTLNVNLVGDTTNVLGVLSGFSATNYAVLKNTFNPTTRTWKFFMKLRTSDDVTTAQAVWSSALREAGGFELEVGESHFRVWLSSNGTTNDIASNVAGVYTVLPNTDYWVSMAFTGSQYLFKYSLNGQDYTTDITINNATPILPETFMIGRNFGTSSEIPFSGSVDLNYCSLSIAGNVRWTGMKQNDPYTPQELSVSFDGEKYTATYAKDTQEFESGEVMKNNTFGLVSQNMTLLNLTDSTFDWWTWNNILTQQTTKEQKWMFRIGTVEGGIGNIESTQPYYPYRIGDGGSSNTFALTSEGKAKPIGSLYIAPNSMVLDDLPEKYANAYIMRQSIPVAPMVMSTSSTGTSFTSNIGAYVEVRNAGNLTLYAGSGGEVVFTNFVGAMFIPPACNVTCTSTMNYRVF